MTRTTTEPTRESTVIQPDGRRTAYAEWGDLAGRPVVLLHGLPGSRLFCPDLDATRGAGVRLVTVDRPGYGRSDPRPGRTLEDWSDDFLILSSELGISPCPVLGWSAGAAYALAVAFHHRGLVSRLGLLAGAGPIDRVPGVWDSLPPSDRQLIERVRSEGESARQAVLDDVRHLSDDPDSILVVDPETSSDFAGRPDLRPALLTMFREAVRQGPAGIADDVIAEDCHPWGFDLEAVDCPADIWWGEEDVLVPRVHSDYFADSLPASTMHVVPRAGHALPTGHWADILTSALTA